MFESCLAADGGSRRTDFGHGIHGGLWIEQSQAPGPGAAAAASGPGAGRSSPKAPAARSHYRSDRRFAAAFPGRRARAASSGTSTGRGPSSTARSRLLLESPYGARTDARLREHFDRLVDRINAYEVTALAQGDGFAEKTSEPASIDELLKIATFPKPAPGAATEKTVKADLAATEHDVPIPQNDRVLGLRRAVPGPAARLHPGEPDARHEVPADDPGRVPRRGAAARSRLHPGDRERLQDQRAVEGERAGPVAVHAGHGDRAGAQDRLVRRRALGSREGHRRRRALPEDAVTTCSTATGTSCSRPTTAASAACSAR